MKIDEFGIVSVNFQRFLKTNEPFVLASQTSQVFYAINNCNKGWHVVQKTQPRDLYAMRSQLDDDIKHIDLSNEAYQHGESFHP